jgi:hypothetical protein
MHSVAASQIAVEGADALRHQPLSGIPYKVYGAAAGHAHVGLGPFLAASATARALRILAVGLLVGGFGACTARWRRFYGHYLVAFVVLFSSGLASVYLYWSH